MKITADRLKYLREQRRLSQGQIQQFTGIAQTSYSELERGEKKGQLLETIAKLAAYFGVSTDYLLGVTDDPRPAAERTGPLLQTSEAQEVPPLLDILPDEKRGLVAALVRQMAADERQTAAEMMQVLELISDLGGPEFQARVMAELRRRGLLPGLPEE